MMHFRIFTLLPQLFESFFHTSLIARGIAHQIISYELVNWRTEFGLGRYRQVDDHPYGGGVGMVLMCEPIYQALLRYDVVSRLYSPPAGSRTHFRIYPNNSDFFVWWQQQDPMISHHRKSVTISLTPRGFPLTQKIVEWLTQFDDISILCGRYEGFDARVSECVDLELSIGAFVTNGGEIPAMALIESVARLIPGFVTKNSSVMHDSFSSELNIYRELEKHIVGARRLAQELLHQETQHKSVSPASLFDNGWWYENILPSIEHPQYTRAEEWRGWCVPEVLLSGNHKDIQFWRHNWYKML